MPELAYRDVTEAAAWLCGKFGFELRLQIGNHRAQLMFEKGAVIIMERSSSALSTGIGHHHSVLVRVSNIDAHYQRVVKGGVKILRPLADHPYGERQYTAEDFGGHVWTFSQTITDSDPAAWGGVLAKDYLRREATAGRREDFDHYLATVPDAPPAKNDR